MNGLIEKAGKHVGEHGAINGEDHDIQQEAHAEADPEEDLTELELAVAIGGIAVVIGAHRQRGKDDTDDAKDAAAAQGTHDVEYQPQGSGIAAFCRGVAGIARGRVIGRSFALLGAAVEIFAAAGSEIGGIIVAVAALGAVLHVFFIPL